MTQGEQHGTDTNTGSHRRNTFSVNAATPAKVPVPTIGPPALATIFKVRRAVNQSGADPHFYSASLPPPTKNCNLWLRIAGNATPEMQPRESGELFPLQILIFLWNMHWNCSYK
jgi:hypothetical protein